MLHDFFCGVLIAKGQGDTSTPDVWPRRALADIKAYVEG